MKAIKILMPLLLSLCFIAACNNNNTNSGTSPMVNDTTSNPTSDAMDYHPDQRQTLPVSDSSNTIGTDTISGSVATPNTGTMKSVNAKKGSKDSSK